MATAAAACLLTGCLMLTWGATPAGGLSVHDTPGGVAIGTWSGSAEVLAVDGDWALVSMSGWVAAANVDARGAEGYRVQGSPGGGLWAIGVSVVDDWGFAMVSGRIVNGTGQDFEPDDYLRVEIVFVDSDGLVVGIRSVSFDNLPSGDARAFSYESAFDAEKVVAVEFQM